jgi:hypothetical protein
MTVYEGTIGFKLGPEQDSSTEAVLSCFHVLCIREVWKTPANILSWGNANRITR